MDVAEMLQYAETVAVTEKFPVWVPADETTEMVMVSV
jgi:hypothetical protein